MFVKRFSFIRVGVGVLATFPFAQVAVGQTDDGAPTAQTRSRFAEASRLLKADKPAVACPMLEEIVTSAPQYTAAKWSLADCYARTGKLVSALRLYTILEQEATDQGQDTPRRQAAEKRASIEPRISHLRIVVPETVKDAKDLTILNDGERLYPQQWGIAIPVDRGAHTIEARFPGETPWKRVVDVWQEQASVDVNVEIPLPYRSEKPKKSPESTNTPLAPMQSRTPSNSPVRETWGTRQTIGLASVGIGVMGLGLGIAFGAAALSAKNESNASHCNGRNQCDSTGIDLRKDAVSYGNVSTGMFIAGGLLAAGGFTLF